MSTTKSLKKKKKKKKKKPILFLSSCFLGFNLKRAIVRFFYNFLLYHQRSKPRQVGYVGKTSMISARELKWYTHQQITSKVAPPNFSTFHCNIKIFYYTQYSSSTHFGGRQLKIAPFFFSLPLFFGFSADRCSCSYCVVSVDTQPTYSSSSWS